MAFDLPEIGRRYYDLVLQKTVNRLAEYLDGRVKQRELVIDDCQLAAMQFMLMRQASLLCPSSSRSRRSHPRSVSRG